MFRRSHKKDCLAETEVSLLSEKTLGGLKSGPVFRHPLSCVWANHHPLENYLRGEKRVCYTKSGVMDSCSGGGREPSHPDLRFALLRYFEPFPSFDRYFRRTLKVERSHKPVTIKHCISEEENIKILQFLGKNENDGFRLLPLQTAPSPSTSR